MDKMQEKVQEFKADAPLLVEAGFIAIKQVDQESAQNCFYAAMVLDPELSLPVLGLGLVAMLQLDLEEAKKLFNTVLQKEPNNEMAKTYLGVANLYEVTDEGLKEGKKWIDEAMDSTSESELKKLGKYSEELHSEIKKKMKDLHPLEQNKKLPPNKRLKK